MIAFENVWINELVPIHALINIQITWHDVVDDTHYIIFKDTYQDLLCLWIIIFSLGMLVAFSSAMFMRTFPLTIRPDIDNLLVWRNHFSYFKANCVLNDNQKQAKNGTNLSNLVLNISCVLVWTNITLITFQNLGGKFFSSAFKYRKSKCTTHTVKIKLWQIHAGLPNLEKGWECDPELITAQKPIFTIFKKNLHK